MDIYIDIKNGDFLNLERDEGARRHVEVRGPGGQAGWKQKLEEADHGNWFRRDLAHTLADFSLSHGSHPGLQRDVKL